MGAAEVVGDLQGVVQQGLAAGDDGGVVAGDVGVEGEAT